MELNQRPIPEPALRDKDAVEVLRVWIAEEGLHCSLKIGMYEESTQVPEGRAWGKILADVARHIANALEQGYKHDAVQSLADIRDVFLTELEAPSTNAHGSFVDRH